MSPPRSKIALIGFLLMSGCTVDSPVDSPIDAGTDHGETALSPAAAKGRQVFRFDTYGNERFWTDTLEMHQVIQTSVDPLTALEVGLKVDSKRLPPRFLADADLTDPTTTVELLRRDAVLGLRAKVTGKGTIQEIGITCALCHSTVDNSVGAGIGNRLDGWPNVDLDVGRILSLSPFLQDPDIQMVLTSWGPGFYDPYWNHDGINAPVVIPPAFGLQGVPLETYTGEGPISYWNAYVAVTQMHGQGSFSEPLLGINIVNRPDLVTQKLPILLAYQLSLQTPPPPLEASTLKRLPQGKKCSPQHVHLVMSPPCSLTHPHYTMPLRRESIRFTRRGERQENIALRRCARCGNTRRTSTMEAPKPWRMSSIIMTMPWGLVLQRARRQTWWSILRASSRFGTYRPPLVGPLRTTH